MAYEGVPSEAPRDLDGETAAETYLSLALCPLWFRSVRTRSPPTCR
jgi:hypothetical protein